MKLVDVAFRTGIDLTLQLPSGTDHLYLDDAVGALQQAQAALAAVEDRDLHERASALVASLQSESQRGQRQLLLRARDFSGLRQDAVDLVFGTLRQAVAENMG